MENKRATNYKLKILLSFIVLIAAVFYMRGHFNQIYRERSRSRLRNFKTDNVRHRLPDRKPDKTSWDRYSNLQDKGGKNTGDFAKDKKSDKTSSDRYSSLQQDKLGENTGDFAKKEPVETKLNDFADKRMTWSDDTNKVDTDRKENNESDTVKKSEAPILEKTKENTLQSKANDSVDKSVVNKTTTGRKKLTLRTVTKIVREILDRLNISRSNTTFGRQLETNTLSDTKVGNISKEILRQNFSRTIAKAVISVLTKGPRNYTLQKQLWKDYLNNTQQLRLNNYLQQANFRDSSQRSRYVDKYQQLDGKLQPRSSHDYPSLRVNNQGYRDNSQKLHHRDDHPQSVYRDNQVKPTYRDQPQLGIRDQPQLGIREQPQHGNREQPQLGIRQQPQQGIGEQPQLGIGEQPQLGIRQQPQQGIRQQTQQGIREQPQQGYNDQPQPGYRENHLPVGNGGQQSRYRNDHGSSLSRLRQNQQQMLKGDQQPSKYLNDGQQQSKYRDNRQQPGYSNDHQKKNDGDYAQQPMKRNIQQRYQANPIKTRSVDKQPNWYRDSTQLKFLMDYPERKRSVNDIKKTDKEQGNEVKRSIEDIKERDKIDKEQGNEVKKLNEKRSIEDIKERDKIDKELGKEVNKVDIKRSVKEPPPKAKTLVENVKQDKTEREI